MNVMPIHTPRINLGIRGVGFAIRELREKAGLSLSDLSTLSQLPQETIASFEAGGYLDLLSIVNISGAFGMTPPQFVKRCGIFCRERGIPTPRFDRINAAAPPYQPAPKVPDAVPDPT